MLKGLQVIKLLRAQRNVSKRLLDFWKRLIRIQVENSKFDFLVQRILAFLTLTSDLILFTISVFLVAKSQLTVGTFIAVMEYFSRANSLLLALGETNKSIQQNIVSIRKVNEILNTSTETTGKLPAIQIHKGEIEFQNVFFTIRVILHY